ncbi:MAG TPA: addiction module toxin, HicA family [Firmicutes bacterium]|nr:addiction module toxin, HicA family [Bacillota bacterium]
MTRLPRVSGKDVVRALQRGGFRLVHIRGSHHYLEPPGGGVLVTVPVHGSRVLKPKTTRRGDPGRAGPPAWLADPAWTNPRRSRPSTPAAGPNCTVAAPAPASFFSGAPGVGHQYTRPGG